MLAPGSVPGGVAPMGRGGRAAQPSEASMGPRLDPGRPGRTAAVTLLFLAAAVAVPADTIVGWNDLGMHCMDSDYRVFSILPPFNTIHGHVIDAGGRLVLSPAGLTVTYQAVADPGGSINSYSTGKTTFWDWVEPLYGVPLAAETGLAGYAMPGPANQPQAMAFDPGFAWFSGRRRPNLTHNTYPMFRLEARDGAGTLRAATEIVLPVSDEMSCRGCHASGANPAAEPFGGWVQDPDPERDFRLNILRLHTDYQSSDPDFVAALATAGYHPAGLEATIVQDGHPVLCARCHLSNALPGTGIGDIRPLTRAVHGWHAGVNDPLTGLPLGDSTSRDACYRCHPGSTTRCLRGAMGAALLPGGEPAMQCQSCHGAMAAVGARVRVGWLEQPACQDCHTGTELRNNGEVRCLSVFEPGGGRRQAVDPTFATNPDVPAPGFSLYRFSRGHGTLQCEACHGSTHAEYPSSHPSDNLQSERLQGHPGMLIDCQGCHGADPMSRDRGPHGLHSVSQWWVDVHGDWVNNVGTRTCKACHGIDLAGTVLSRAQGDRDFIGPDGVPVSFPRRTTLGCTACHEAEWPVDDILRSLHRQPTASVFPLPGYDLLSPAPPYVDPQAVLVEPNLYFYQVATRPTVRLLKQGQSVAVYF
jgi:hypothetical protein